MYVWRVLVKGPRDTDWQPLNKKLYLEKRHATITMRYHGGEKAEWDDLLNLWYNPNNSLCFRIERAELKDWELVDGNKSEENKSRN